MQDSTTDAPGQTIVVFAAVYTIHADTLIVVLKFDRKWEEKLSLVKQGDIINVAYRISDIDSLSMELDRCELFDR